MRGTKKHLCDSQKRLYRISVKFNPKTFTASYLSKKLEESNNASKHCGHAWNFSRCYSLRSLVFCLRGGRRMNIIFDFLLRWRHVIHLSSDARKFNLLRKTNILFERWRNCGVSSNMNRTEQPIIIRHRRA